MQDGKEPARRRKACLHSWGLTSAQGSRSRRECGETCVSLMGMSGKPADATLADNTSVCACGDTEMILLVRMLTSLGRTHRPDHGHVNHEVPQP